MKILVQMLSRFALLMSGLVLIVPAISAGAQSGAPPQYVLEWSDSFSSPVLDVTRWNYRTDIKAKSAQLPANVSVEGGQLRIALRRQNFGGQEYTGGGVVSRAAFRYGYFQVEAKTTTNPGWHSSFWMLAGTGATTFAPSARTEIDDFEINSSASEVISMGRLEWLGGKAVGSTRCNANYKPGWNSAEAYHTYGLEWTEQEIRYYLDGALICTQPYPPTQYTHDALNIWLTAIGYSPNVAVTDPDSGVSFRNVSYFIRDYYLVDGDSGYVEYGPGWGDSLLPGYSRIPSRVSCQAGASAMYTPTILQGGKYDVQVYVVPSADDDPAAQFTIAFSGGNTTRTIHANAGVEGWVDLGSYPFATGADGSVTNANSGTGCTRTSMVKFVRQ